jgi:pyrroline-5-carboxylate reductase
MLQKMIGIIGCGNMGSALMENLRRRMADIDLVVFDIDQEKAKVVGKRIGVDPVSSVAQLVEESAILIIAVKPQDIDGVLGELKGCVRRLVISIAAGVTLSHLVSKLGPGVAVVRAMPNINAMIGHSVTGISFNAEVKKEDEAVVKKIFESVGEVVVVPESLMNAVTAISGSGPAFVAYLALELGEEAVKEVMVREAIGLGLEAAAARKFVDGTLSGTRRMLAANPDAGSLIQRVSSKGGTTEAGMQVLQEKGKTKEALAEAIRAAHRRAAELSKI